MAKNDGGLRKLFSEKIAGVHWQPIETGGTGRGIPDMNGCRDEREIWIEFKKSDHWAVEVRPEQVAWIERRYRHGGRCYVAVRRADDELWLLAHGAARWLATPRRSLKDVPEALILGRWTGGLRAWDWEAVEALLFPS
jgi:hypothetical protein